MAASNTQFKVENGLFVQGTANVEGNAKVNGDFWATGNVRLSGTGNSDFIPYNNTFALGNSDNRWVVYGSNGFFSANITITDTVNTDKLIATTYVNPSANGKALGNTTARWELYSNSVNFISANVSSKIWVTSTPATFNASSGVASATDFITTQAAHNFTDGEVVQYIVSAGNTAVSGLTNAATYYVVSSNTTAFKLSSTYGGSAIDLTAGTSETGHTLTPIRVAISNDGAVALPVGIANVGTLRVLGGATVNGTTTLSTTQINGVSTISGNVAVDGTLLFLDVINNIVGIGNSAPSTVDLVTIQGNVVFNTANTTGLRFTTATAAINSAVVLLANTTNSRFTFTTYDSSNSTVKDGGFDFIGTNSSVTTTLLSFNKNDFLYKSGNVVHAGNFGIYNVSGTRVGP